MEKLLVGHWVLCTAVHPRERDALAAQVAQCGGEFLTAFNIRDPPHLVITRSVRSPKYRALMRAHPHTPAVTPDWLTASVEVGARAGGGEARWWCWCWCQCSVCVCVCGCCKMLPPWSMGPSTSAAPGLYCDVSLCAPVSRRAGCCPRTRSGWAPSWASRCASRGCRPARRPRWRPS